MRLPILVLAVSLLSILPGCANHRVASKATPAPAAAAVTIKPEPRDGRGFFRFHMSQSGKQMSADQFDEWMKNNGIRVATGKPAPVPAK
jgi:basic membrane lipoprotein Med (substrate-binding protein (PBP1-ABC) superfamily)